MIANLISGLGRAVCHQMSERSLFIDGQLPICARCFGIFLGVLTTHLYLLAIPRKGYRLPRLPVSLGLVAAISIMALDGVTSYLGMRDTTNLIRLVTGLGMGLSFPLFYKPLASEDFQPGPESVGASDLLIVLTLGSGLGILAWYGLPASWLFWAVLFFLGHALLYGSIIRLVLARFALNRWYWVAAGYVAFVVTLNMARTILSL